MKEETRVLLSSSNNAAPEEDDEGEDDDDDEALLPLATPGMTASLRRNEQQKDNDVSGLAGQQTNRHRHLFVLLEKKTLRNLLVVMTGL